MIELNGKQKRHLRALANSIKATISIGKIGVTENTFLSINQGFNTKELLKIKIQEGCSEEKEEMAHKIEKATGAVLVQMIGHILLFYKPNKENPKIDWPE